MVELLYISIVGATGGFIGAPVFSWLHVRATGGIMWAPEFSCLHMGANQASLELLSLRHELLLLPSAFHDDRSQVRHQNFHSPSPKSTTRLPMSSEMPGGWTLYVSLNDLEFGARETPRCMLLEASQKCPVRFSSFGLSRIFTEDTDSGVPWTTFFGAADERVLADRNCWWIRSSGRDCWRIRLLDILDSIL